MKLRSKLLYLLGTSTILLGLIAFMAPQAKAAIFTVTNTNDSGAGSLRQALIDANNNVDEDTINFSIGSGAQQIVPSSMLPAITAPVIIDGTSQPGFSDTPLIEISGTNAGSSSVGFWVEGNSGGTTIKGLVINRFGANGIIIFTSSVTVVGNYIGTNAAGTAAAANGTDGIGIFSGSGASSASDNVIGGTTAANRNVISGNTGNGIGITAQTGGVASDNTISGNYIGTNAAGTAAIPNGGDGFLLNHAQGSATLTGNVIGGSASTTPDGACTGACNLISGNAANGGGLWHSGVSSNSVIGNYVGTNAAGTSAIPNGDIGIELNESPNNTVGGITPEARNILSGNTGAGLFITGAAATGSIVKGNYVGTNSAGTAAVANAKMGISIGPSVGAAGASNGTIGGTTGTTAGGACTGACNLISGNNQNGILISGSDSSGHQILGNYIGTNAAGTGSIGNVLDGIGTLGVLGNIIGDGTSAGRNVISGNGGAGVIMVGGISSGNKINGNYIGLTSAGGSMGNSNRGVVLSGATEVAITGNSIANNASLGIDLGNNGTIEANDSADGDSGTNKTQNYPNIYSARTAGGTTNIGGQFNSVPSSNFQLEFFSSDGCNGGVPTNYGEGQNYLGATAVSTDVFGNTAFSFTPGSAVSGNKYITATAIRKSGATPIETSEFSKCVLVNVTKPALTNGANWFLKDYLNTGPGDYAFGYGFPAQFLMCAWDGNQLGVKLPVIFAGTTWYMRASYTTGTADNTFGYGASGSQAVCGDWNGDGIETVGVFTSNGTWLLRDSNSSGAADAGNFQYGTGTDKPMVGDWDGNGTDTVGVVNTSNNWNLRNTNSSGGADFTFGYGFTPGYPVVGDWDGNGTDTIGSVSIGGTWALRTANSSGAPTGTFQFGFPGTVPLAW